MTHPKPADRPANPNFSSGPCAKPPTFSLDRLADAPLGRSHRAAAGKAKFEAECAECHEAGDFEGEDAAALADSLKQISAGQMKHKQALKLSDAEAADLAAFMASGGK
jgi:mono/diheme cytochrome c family protein